MKGEKYTGTRKEEKQTACLRVYVKIYSYLGKISWWDF